MLLAFDRVENPKIGGGYPDLGDGTLRKIPGGERVKVWLMISLTTFILPAGNLDWCNEISGNDGDSFWNSGIHHRLQWVYLPQ
jgi:hypothetical protein